MLIVMETDPVRQCLVWTNQRWWDAGAIEQTIITPPGLCQIWEVCMCRRDDRRKWDSGPKGQTQSLSLKIIINESMNHWNSVTQNCVATKEEQTRVVVFFPNIWIETNEPCIQSRHSQWTKKFTGPVVSPVQNIYSLFHLYKIFINNIMLLSPAWLYMPLATLSPLCTSLSIPHCWPFKIFIQTSTTCGHSLLSKTLFKFHM